MNGEPELILRPIRADELAYFDLWTSPDVDPFNFFGFKTGHRARAGFAANGLISPEEGTVVAVVDDLVIGDLSWHSRPYAPPGSTPALNIGIRLLPEHRGNGYGTRAQRALVEHLFGVYPINRIEASTDVLNIAEQRALEKAGFQREGIVRGAQWRAGQWNDLVQFSRVRSDLG